MKLPFDRELVTMRAVGANPEFVTLVNMWAARRTDTARAWTVGAMETQFGLFSAGDANKLILWSKSTRRKKPVSIVVCPEWDGPKDFVHKRNLGNVCMYLLEANDEELDRDREETAAWSKEEG